PAATPGRPPNPSHAAATAGTSASTASHGHAVNPGAASGDTPSTAPAVSATAPAPTAPIAATSADDGRGASTSCHHIPASCPTPGVADRDDVDPVSRAR